MVKQACDWGRSRVRAAGSASVVDVPFGAVPCHPWGSDSGVTVVDLRGCGVGSLGQS